MQVTVRHACGHKSRVEVGDGPAADRSARAFRASQRECPECEAQQQIADEAEMLGRLRMQVLSVQVEQQRRATLRPQGK